MGVGGTNVAVETADVALAADDLRALLDLRDLGRRSITLIRQNYGMSIAVNAAGPVVSAGGALSPVVAAIRHNVSSVAVVGNSSRLIRYRVCAASHDLPRRGCCHGVVNLASPGSNIERGRAAPDSNKVW
jgi:cation-transporting P-type ATPase C